MSFREVGCGLLLGLSLGLSSVVLLAADSPDDRQITDPKSVVSASNPVPAGRCPFPSFITRAARRVHPGLPMASRVVFTTNLTGRTICGRCRPREDFRFNFCSRMIGNQARSGRRMESGLSSSRTSVEANCMTCSRSQAMAARW